MLLLESSEEEVVRVREEAEEGEAEVKEGGGEGREDWESSEVSIFFLLNKPKEKVEGKMREEGFFTKWKRRTFKMMMKKKRRRRRRKGKKGKKKKKNVNGIE